MNRALYLSSNLMIWKIRSGTLTLTRPLIMGILNVTPDSFYDGGRFLEPEQAADQARRLVAQGADLLDLGAESTRPDADPVSEEEELNRLLPVLVEIGESIQVPISIDTTKSGVARGALEQRADIINDVSGLRGDPEMGRVIKDFDAGVVLMHRRGTAKTMQSLARYEDMASEVIDELRQSVEIAASNGISLEQIVVDPGIGFSKTADQNLEVLRRLDTFEQIGRPILIGPSRKSFIGAVTKQTPEQRLFGTVAACVLALQRGARIFRVHDVAPVKEALLVAEGILKGRREERGNVGVPLVGARRGTVTSNRADSRRKEGGQARPAPMGRQFPVVLPDDA